MSAHRRTDPELRDRVALYLFGGMQGSEARGFDEHLVACEVCQAEVARLRPVVDDLVLLGPEVEPPDRLRERVRASTRAAHTLHSKLGRTWISADVPGVEVCQLWLDAESRRQTMLIRMDAGSSLPAHRHGGPEECYVVRGDLHDGDLSLAAGDYIRFERGSQHEVSSREGCTLLVTSSLSDRRIDSR